MSIAMSHEGRRKIVNKSMNRSMVCD